MSRYLQTLPLSQAGPRRAEPPRKTDAVFQALLLLDAGVPAGRILKAIERMSGVEQFRTAVTPRSRAA